MERTYTIGPRTFVLDEGKAEAALAAKRVVGDGYVFVWFYDVLSAIVWLPIALTVLASQGWPLTWSLLWAPIVSGVIHIAYQLWLQTGYDRADLGVVYPLARGVGPLLTMLVAVAFGGERPGPAALIALAEPWRPWRAVAARALWAYYHVAKGREGVR